MTNTENFFDFKKACDAAVNGEKRTANFDKNLVRREWLKTINSLFPCEAYPRNYMFYMLVLVSCAINTKRDEKDDKNTFYEHFYLYAKKAAELLGVKGFPQVKEILDTLAKAKLIRCKIEGSSLNKRGIKFRVQLLSCTEYINEGYFGRSKEDRENHIKNVNFQNGFCFVNLRHLIEKVTNVIPDYPCGCKDVWVILLNDTVYKDEQTENEDMYNHHIIQFGHLCCGDNEGDAISEPNFYINVEELAKFLHISYSALNEMLNTMEDKRIITRHFIRNRGTAIVLTMLDEDRNDPDYNDTLDRVFEVITLEAYKYSIKRHSKKFGAHNFINKIITKGFEVIAVKRRDKVFKRLELFRNRVIDAIMDNEKDTGVILKPAYASGLDDWDYDDLPFPF